METTVFVKKNQSVSDVFTSIVETIARHGVKTDLRSIVTFNFSSLFNGRILLIRGLGRVSSRKLVD